MNEHEADIGGLKREWLAARVVLIVGFAVAIGYGIYAAHVWRTGIVQKREQIAAQMAAEQASASADQNNGQAGVLVCRQALAAAQSFGIVPEYTKLKNGQPQATQVTGRYTCQAATDSSVFALAIDLICRELRDPRCTSLYSVTQNGGAVLYQRHD